MKKQLAVAVLAALCLAAPVSSPAAIPEGGLDYGIVGWPIPDPLILNHTTPRTATLLAEALRAEKVSFRRVRLLEDLGTSRLAEGVPDVVAALGDTDASVRQAAADAIVVLATDDSRSEASRARLLGNAEAIGQLKKLLSDTDPAVRASALPALATIEPSGNAVVTALGSSDEALLSAAIGLARSPEEGTVLLQRLGNVPAALKPRALLAIGRSKPAGAAAQLVQLATPQLEVPQLASACQAIGMLGTGEALPRLMELLSHKHSVVRREAMLAAGACAAPEAARKLGLQMLQDSDATVRQAAATVLGRCLTPEVVPNLVPHLADPYEPLWKATRDALAQAPDQPTREIVIKAAGELLDSSDPRRREDGSYLLGRFRSDYKFERHLALLSDGYQPLVTQVAESLGLIGRQEARPGIVALAQGAGGANLAATNALVAGGRLGASELIPVCQRVIGMDPRFSFPPARAAAVFTIGATVDAKSPAVQTLFTVLESQMESGLAKFEAVKALGNLRCPEAIGRIEKFPSSDAPAMQWIIQWATARITDQPAQHPRTPTKWRADTSIRDMAEQGR